MNGAVKAGGPAFPVDMTYTTPDGIRTRLASDGMTLRDYFAAKAMQGLLSDSEIRGTAQDFAWRAYELADAMLKARDAT